VRSPENVPRSVALELSSVCQFTCSYCDKRNWRELGLDRTAPFLDEGLFRRLVDEIATWALTPRLTLSYEGESLLHPRFAEMIEYAAAVGLRPWVTTSLLGGDDRALAAMVEHASTISVSLDGLAPGFCRVRGTPEQYRRVRERLRLLTEIGSGGRRRAKVAASMVRPVSSARTSAAVRRFVQDCAEFVDEVNIWPELAFGATDIRLNPPPKLARHLRRRRTCLQASGFLAVLSDARLSPCCVTSRVRFRDLDSRGGLAAVLDSAAYRAFVDRHRTGALAGTPCEACDGWLEDCFETEEAIFMLNGTALPAFREGLCLRIPTRRTGNRAGPPPIQDQGSPGRDPVLAPLALGTRVGWGTSMQEDTARVVAAVSNGITTFDTGPDFSEGLAERALGAALREAASRGDVDQADVTFIARVGRLPAGGRRPAGSLSGAHCFTRAWLLESFARTQESLGIDLVNVLLLQEPEWLRTLGPRRFQESLRCAVGLIEELRSRKRVDVYGVSSLVGLMSHADHPLHLEIEELLAAAEEVGGAGHGLRVLSVPVHAGVLQSLSTPRQTVQDERLGLLAAAERLGLTTVAVAPLAHGRLLSRLPEGTIDEEGRTYTVPQWLIQLARSQPSVCTCVLGATYEDHVREAAVVLPRSRWSVPTLRGVAP
jgi:aryl-alcohol dehydrogenase-like predicted oxidoreductase